MNSQFMVDILWTVGIVVLFAFVAFAVGYGIYWLIRAIEYWNPWP